MGERQRIGGGAGRHQEDRDLMLEDLRETALDPRRPGVVAVGERRALVRGRDGGEDFGRDAGGVVAGEIHALLRGGRIRE